MLKEQVKITNEEIWRRTGQAQAGPHPAKTNVRHSTPCSKMEPKGNGREEDPTPPGEGPWRLKGGRWDTPGASWKFCPETGPSGGSLWSTYAPHGVQGYKSFKSSLIIICFESNINFRLLHHCYNWLRPYFATLFVSVPTFDRFSAHRFTINF